MPDAEIAAMSTIAGLLDPLTEDQRQRVVTWTIDRFSLAGLSGPRGGGSHRHQDGLGQGEDGADPAQFEHFAEMFAAASPTSGADKALVAAYWLQVHEGKPTFGSAEVNKELKELGHASSKGINKDLQTGIDKRPALVLQLKKAGNARQGRKTYKLSAEGIKVVEAMLNGSST